MSTIGKNNLGAEQVVQRETESRSERTVTAAERDSSHSDRAAIAGDRGEAVWSCSGDDIFGSGAAGDVCNPHRCIHRYLPHCREVDYQTFVAQGSSCPVMSAAPH